MRSSFDSPVRRSAILRAAQPKGRRYWTFVGFFFSPAPIRPNGRINKNVITHWTALTNQLLNVKIY